MRLFASRAPPPCVLCYIPRKAASIQLHQRKKRHQLRCALERQICGEPTNNWHREKCPQPAVGPVRPAGHCSDRDNDHSGLSRARFVETARDRHRDVCDSALAAAGNSVSRRRNGLCYCNLGNTGRGLGPIGVRAMGAGAGRGIQRPRSPVDIVSGRGLHRESQPIDRGPALHVGGKGQAALVARCARCGRGGGVGVDLDVEVYLKKGVVPDQLLTTFLPVFPVAASSFLYFLTPLLLCFLHVRQTPSA